MESTKKDTKCLVPQSSECLYASCYCEENVYKLCEHVKNISLSDLKNCHAVFISNRKKVVPLWHQKAGPDSDNPVLWDYHVIFIHHPGSDLPTLVYDLDTTLPFPSQFPTYVAKTFRTESEINPDYHRSFRVIPAGTFLENFASDRSHMKGEGGEWMQTPPTWDCIATERTKHNLEEYISMEEGTGEGVVLNLEDFRKMFD